MLVIDFIDILSIIILTWNIKKTDCIKQNSSIVTKDYFEIDRKFPPIFINNTRTTVTVASGNTATLKCRVHNLEGRTVSWIRKKDLHIMTMGSDVYSNDRRIQVHHPRGNNERDDWLLHIHQAKPKDSGAYECQINTEPKKSKGYKLHVKVSRAQILGDQDVLVQAGNDINLICRSEELSGTLNHVIWYRNNIQIENLLYRGGISVVTERRRRYSRLLVSKVTKDDGGNYTCAPSNARADSVMVYVISDL